MASSVAVILLLLCFACLFATESQCPAGRCSGEANPEIASMEITLLQRPRRDATALEEVLHEDSTNPATQDLQKRKTRLLKELAILGVELDNLEQHPQLESGIAFKHNISNRVISRAMDYCQRSLAEDGGCCLDAGPPQEDGKSGPVGQGGGKGYPGVEQLDKNRSTKHVPWFCSESTNCGDGQSGVRGADSWFAPHKADCSSARLLHIHGGGWMAGSPTTDGYTTTASRLAKMTDAIVMSIDYPLAPVCLDSDCKEKGGFEVILEFATAAVEYLAVKVPAIKNVPGLKDGCEDDFQKVALIVGGDSSGGGSSYSLTLSLHQSRSKKAEIYGAFMWSPFLSLQCNSPTYISNAYRRVMRNSDWIRNSDSNSSFYYVGDVVSNNNGLDEPADPANDAWSNCRTVAVYYMGGDCRGGVCTEPATLKNPLASTTLASKELLGGGGTGPLPPLFFSAGEAEVLEGEVYVAAQNAAAANHDNQVILDIYDGMWHVFQQYSQGCGNPEGLILWQGELLWNRTAEFIRKVAKTRAIPCAAQRPKGYPVTTLHMTEPYVEDGEVGNNFGMESFSCMGA